MDPITIFVGAAVSVVVQVIKKYWGTTSIWTGATLVGVSIVSGFGLFFLKQYGLWDATLQVIIYAGATYGLIIKNVQEAVPSVQ